MGLPNATKILSTLPGGMRVTVKRGDVVASLAVRTALHDAGQLSLGGLECDPRTHVWTLIADFDPQIRVGDVLHIGDLPAFVVDAITSCGDLISRAQVVICEDTVIVGDVEIACHRALLAEDTATSIEGFLPEDMQGFFVPESILPDGLDIVISMPVQISGEQLLVDKVSRDSKHGILCVTCRRRGDA